MKKITGSEELRKICAGGIVSSFVIGYILKKTVIGIYNYYYDKGQRGY